MIVTNNLNSILVYAQEEAERLWSKHVEPAHLFLGIIRLGKGTAYSLLQKTQWDPAVDKGALERDLKGTEQMVEPVTRSVLTERILRIAEGISREYMADAVGSIHLLLALLRDNINSIAAYLESEYSITYQTVVELYDQPHYVAEKPQEMAEATM